MPESVILSVYQVNINLCKNIGEFASTYTTMPCIVYFYQVLFEFSYVTAKMYRHASLGGVLTYCVSLCVYHVKFNATMCCFMCISGKV